MASLDIKPYKLLVVGDDPRFPGRRPIPIGQNAIVTDPLTLQGIHELAAGVIAADHPAQIHAPSERPDVIGHVGGAPELESLGGHVHDRHRRNPADRSPDILIQDEVPDDEDSSATKLFNIAVQVVYPHRITFPMRLHRTQWLGSPRPSHDQ